MVEPEPGQQQRRTNPCVSANTATPACWSRRSPLGSWLTYSGGAEAAQTRACTDAAFDAGINFFDTANAYGKGAAETALGEILNRHPRDSYILATKVWSPMSDTDKGLSGEQITKQVAVEMKT
jgi:aryl-alcohol dehydrogenase-like predicted oxidoreductase